MVYLPLMPQRLAGGMRLVRRRFDVQAATLGRLGSLEVRLARSGEEVRRAQRLRYRVFYEEMSAIANVRALVSGRRQRHLRPLLRPSAGARSRGRAARRRSSAPTGCCARRSPSGESGFYSAGEFAVDRLLARHRDRSFLELGRSCVLKPYRNKRTVELLWHGIWSYVRQHGIDVMIGCASLEGTDPAPLAPLLAFLRQTARRRRKSGGCAALPGRGVPLDRLRATPATEETALRDLPPLIKGYLRLGAYVCEEAVIDRQFGTTDVFLVLPVERISTRYINYLRRRRQPPRRLSAGPPGRSLARSSALRLRRGIGPASPQACAQPSVAPAPLTRSGFRRLGDRDQRRAEHPLADA